MVDHHAPPQMGEEESTLNLNGSPTHSDDSSSDQGSGEDFDTARIETTQDQNRRVMEARITHENYEKFLPYYFDKTFDTKIDLNDRNFIDPNGHWVRIKIRNDYQDDSPWRAGIDLEKELRLALRRVFRSIYLEKQDATTTSIIYWYEIF